jgi:4-diphosphocytidyl-2-C-methyl-D-erythritol kinase
LQALYDDLLNCGFDVVLMSGSGTSIFCLGEGGGGSWEEIKGRDDLKVWETEFVGRKEGEWYRSKA